MSAASMARCAHHQPLSTEVAEHMHVTLARLAFRNASTVTYGTVKVHAEDWLEWKYVAGPQHQHSSAGCERRHQPAWRRQGAILTACCVCNTAFSTRMLRS